MQRFNFGINLVDPSYGWMQNKVMRSIRPNRRVCRFTLSTDWKHPPASHVQWLTIETPPFLKRVWLTRKRCWSRRRIPHTRHSSGKDSPWRSASRRVSCCCSMLQEPPCCSTLQQGRCGPARRLRPSRPRCFSSTRPSSWLPPRAHTSWFPLCLLSIHPFAVIHVTPTILWKKTHTRLPGEKPENPVHPAECLQAPPSGERVLAPVTAVTWRLSNWSVCELIISANIRFGGKKKNKHQFSPVLLSVSQQLNYTHWRSY